MYKVVVYAISKNEEKHVKRWYESMKEADEIYVLDTGSTDKTVELLSNLGVHVKTQKIDPWRFDVARNASLDLVPKDVDILVCVDLDEIFLPGWRKKLEEIWQPGTTRLKYIYNWSLDELGNAIVSFYSEKIHSHDNFKWIHPVHEVLFYDGEEKFLTTDDIVLNHYPDATKSRSSYLPLLELSVKEDPEDDRNVHYLGREYMYYQKWDDCIKTLHRHLSCKNATWKDERCASMRFLGRAYQAKGYLEEAEDWFKRAITEI